MAGRDKKQKKPGAQKKAQAAQKTRTAQRARTVRRTRLAERPASAPVPAPSGPRWVPVLIRSLVVVAAGYLASLTAAVSFFSGVILLTEEPTRPFTGVAILAGGTLAGPLLLYYGAAKLTARSSELTRTPKGRVLWSLAAYALTALLTVLLDFQFAPFPLAAVPAAFIIGKRTFQAALISCAVLACAVPLLW
ncbi:hypothetical protein ABGB12_22375 [Actinocorallia sp. B10E7]|uniref:hypothetical protein n=1 Tax=Actinocorallia sp. B10E7 TaxID=3153558 RepID=UPI00325F70F4